MKLNFSNKYNQWIILFFLSFIWGSSFILMKYGLKGFSNYHLTSLRIVISFILLLPVILRDIKKLKKADIKWFFLAGWLGTGIPTFLYATAQMHIDSVVAGMINSATPLFTLIVGILLFQFKPKLINMFGIIVGLFGALILTFAGTRISDLEFDLYAFMLVLAPLSYGFNINLIKSKLTGYNGLLITSFGFIFIGPIAIGHLIFSDYSYIQDFQSVIQPFVFIVILAAVCTVFALILFNSLIKYTSPIFSASVTYIIPVFAIMWGFLDNESINFIHVFGLVSVLLGVYLVNTNKK